VLAVKIAITLEACHAADVLQETFKHHGLPEIVNTNQGSQLPLTSLYKRLQIEDAGSVIEPIMENGEIRASVLHAYDSVNEARQSIIQYRVHG